MTDGDVSGDEFGDVSGDEASEVPEEPSGDIPDYLFLMQTMCQLMIQKTDISPETLPDSDVSAAKNLLFFFCRTSTEIMNFVSSNALSGPSLT